MVNTDRKNKTKMCVLLEYQFNAQNHALLDDPQNLGQNLN